MLARLKPPLLFAPPGWVLRGGGLAAALDIDFVNARAYNRGPASIASLLSCTRASAGYYTNADGTLVSFLSNALRYGTNGLLVEEARTNLLLRSQELDNSSWVKDTGTIGANAIAAPDGTVTADSYIPANGSTAATFHQAVTIANATVYVWTAYIKNGPLGTNWVEFTTTAGGTKRSYFNASTGLAGSVAHTSLTVDALAGGWWRVKIVYTSAGTAESCFVCARPGDGNAGNITGDGATAAFYLWGAQLEAGAFATSYIPTTSSSATRAEDVVTAAASAFADCSAAGTFCIAYGFDQAGMGAISDGFRLIEYNKDSSNRAYMLIGSANTYAGLSTAGVSQLDIRPLASVNGVGPYKTAFAWNTNDAQAALQGVLGTQDTSVTTWSGPVTLHLGKGSGAIKSKYLRRLTLWSSRLADASLQALTT